MKSLAVVALILAGSVLEVEMFGYGIGPFQPGIISPFRTTEGVVQEEVVQTGIPTLGQWGQLGAPLISPYPNQQYLPFMSGLYPSMMPQFTTALPFAGTTGILAEQSIVQSEIPAISPWSQLQGSWGYPYAYQQFPQFTTPLPFVGTTGILGGESIIQSEIPAISPWSQLQGSLGYPYAYQQFPQLMSGLYPSIMPQYTTALPLTGTTGIIAEEIIVDQQLPVVSPITPILGESAYLGSTMLPLGLPYQSFGQGLLPFGGLSSSIFGQSMLPLGGLPYPTIGQDLLSFGGLSSSIFGQSMLPLGGLPYQTFGQGLLPFGGLGSAMSAFGTSMPLYSTLATGAMGAGCGIPQVDIQPLPYYVPQYTPQYVPQYVPQYAPYMMPLPPQRIVEVVEEVVVAPTPIAPVVEVVEIVEVVEEIIVPTTPVAPIVEVVEVFEEVIVPTTPVAPVVEVVEVFEEIIIPTTPIAPVVEVVEIIEEVIVPTTPILPVIEPLAPCIPTGWALERCVAMLLQALVGAGGAGYALPQQYEVLEVSRSVEGGIAFFITLEIGVGQCQTYSLVPGSGFGAFGAEQLVGPTWALGAVAPAVCPPVQAMGLPICAVGSF